MDKFQAIPRPPMSLDQLEYRQNQIEEDIRRAEAELQIDSVELATLLYCIEMAYLLDTMKDVLRKTKDRIKKLIEENTTKIKKLREDLEYILL